jgi:hypothetical protein
VSLFAAARLPDNHPMKGASPAGWAAPLSGGIPIYRPSTVVSRTAGSHATLTSPDAVGSIGAFYAEVLAHGGWCVVSHHRGPTVARFSARRDEWGATISIYRTWRATGISISTYPI